MYNLGNNDLKLTLYAFSKETVGKWWNFKNHISRFSRIHLIQDGEQIVRFGGKEYLQTAGNIYLMPPFVPVDYVCTGQCTQYYFIFTAEFEDGLDLFSHVDFTYQQESSHINLELCKRLLTSVPNMALTNSNANDSDFKSEIFGRKCGKLTAEQHLELQGVVRLLLAPFFKDAVPTSTPLRFSKVLQYIENNITANLSLKNLAAQENLDPTYFSDLFKANLGIRPIKYVTGQRLNMASHLLQSTALSVKEVAHESGFTDYDYFFRVFKKETGTTPRHFRTMNP